ncbi:MAG: hypothetical protein JXR10_14575 [Cyclobacteriaceae bacterium]
MEKKLKKCSMLLKSLILHYHGLDEDEKKILEGAAVKLKAEEELEWANEFISEDYLSAFERCKEFFSKNMVDYSNEIKLSQLKEVWEENHQKGYVTEMETTAMINLAKDWGVEHEMLMIIQD